MLNIVSFLINVLCYVCTASVPTYKLNDGHDIPGIALGTFLGLTSDGDLVQSKSNETEQAVLWALDAGYRHIDSAWIYLNEDQIGRALTKKFQQGIKREEVFVTTKLYNDAHAKDAVLPALRRSLEDLNLNYVDLYLIHFPTAFFKYGHLIVLHEDTDPTCRDLLRILIKNGMGATAEDIPRLHCIHRLPTTGLNGSYDNIDYVETWQGMMEAKSQGLTKSIGLSNFNKTQIQRVLDLGLEKPAALQIEVNLNMQQPELRSYCKQQNIVVMGYSPFGSLFYHRAREDAPPPRVDEPALVEIANKYNKTVPQVNLRYMVELGVIPLPKSLNKSHIEENIDVFDFELTSTERELMKSYDKNYRTLPMSDFHDHPYFPFEKQ